jgi:predicted ATP-grasp superfamily ATP-dependent carboligase
MTDVTVGEILRRKEAFDKCVILPFEDYDKYLQVTDKARLFTLAKILGVPVPKTYMSSGSPENEDPAGGLSGMEYPVVVKSCFSKIRSGDSTIDSVVRYANGKEELQSILSCDVFKKFPYLVQERVQGPGVGIFLLMDNGKVLATFAHRRIREKPPSGGVSVLCESISPPADALRAAITILGHVHWSGVAMVEFKHDEKENVHKLIEVNARFWGSLQLAISSGVDFPYMLFQLATGGAIEEPKQYQAGIKSRWLLGDLDHLLIRLLKKSSTLSLPKNCPSRLNVAAEFFFDFFKPSVTNEILRKDDPRPFLYELKQYIKYMFH